MNNTTKIAIVAAIIIVIVIIVIVLYKKNSGNATSAPSAAVMVANPAAMTMTKYPLTASQITITTPHSSFANTANLIDGNTQALALHTLNKGIITIDIGKDIPISKLAIYNRVDCCTDRIVGATVTVYNNTGRSPMTHVISAADIATTPIIVPVNTYGSRITIQQTTGEGIVNINEVEVYTAS